MGLSPENVRGDADPIDREVGLGLHDATIVKMACQDQDQDEDEDDDNEEKAAEKNGRRKDIMKVEVEQVKVTAAASKGLLDYSGRTPCSGTGAGCRLQRGGRYHAAVSSEGIDREPVIRHGDRHQLLRTSRWLALHRPRPKETALRQMPWQSTTFL